MKIKILFFGLLMFVFSALGTPLQAAPEKKLIRIDGIARSYIIDVPSDFTKRSNAPLVFVLHGGGGNAESAIRMSGFSDVALGDGAIIVYPEGSGRLRNKLKTWNATHCCGYAIENNVDDIAYFDQLIDYLLKFYSIDPNRIFVTGMSNGGMMSHQLAIALPHKIRAIAPVVGGLFGDEKTPASPVAALIINGLLDQSVPYKGGQTSGAYKSAWDGTPLKPARDQAAFWAKVNDCNKFEEKKPTAEEDALPYILYDYDCPKGADVQHYVLKELGHVWPGGEKGRARAEDPTSEFNASQVIWDFFKAQN